MMRTSLPVFIWQKAARRAMKVFFIVICMSPMFVIAAESEEQIPRNPALSSSFQTDYVVQVLLSLMLVVGVIVLLSFMLKKINLQSRTGSGAVRILTVVPLGAKDRLLLVAVGDEQLLLGSSPGSVQKLHILDKPIDPNSNFGPVTEEKSFMSVLNSVRRGHQS